MLLGQILRREGFCSGQDILDALDKQQAGDERRLGEILFSLGKIVQLDLIRALEIQQSEP